jgi:dihydrofolate reductase
MGRVVVGMRTSVDGFVADRDGDSSALYPDIGELRENEVVKQAISSTGAVVLGRRSYDMADGDMTGYEFQVPIFVLTHNAPEKKPRGENERLSVTFVDEDIETVIGRAKKVAGEKDVVVIGADTSQQDLHAGLVDEIGIGIVPVLFGEGIRFLDRLGSNRVELERIRVTETAADTDIRFRVKNQKEKASRQRASADREAG